MSPRGPSSHFTEALLKFNFITDVYAKVVEMDLFEAGFDTEWESIQVPKMDHDEWAGVKRKYWTLPEYKLPICSFIG